MFNKSPLPIPSWGIPLVTFLKDDSVTATLADIFYGEAAPSDRNVCLMLSNFLFKLPFLVTCLETTRAKDLQLMLLV